MSQNHDVDVVVVVVEEEEEEEEDVASCRGRHLMLPPELHIHVHTTHTLTQKIWAWVEAQIVRENMIGLLFSRLKITIVIKTKLNFVFILFFIIGVEIII